MAYDELLAFGLMVVGTAEVGGQLPLDPPYLNRNMNKACFITSCTSRFSNFPTVLGLVELGNCSIRDKIYWKGVHFGERQYGTSKRFSTRGPSLSDFH